MCGWAEKRKKDSRTDAAEFIGRNYEEEKTMNDQFGNKVPDDLIALECGPDRFTDEEIKIIVDATWYEVTHSHGQDLAVSLSAIEGVIDGCYPLGDTPLEIMAVDDCLKRWSIDDGFYHA